MSYQLALQNPSTYQRNGYVSVPWNDIYDQTKIPPEAFRLRDHLGNYLPLQIDRIDPDDRKRDVLVFRYDLPINPGPDDYSMPSTAVDIERDDSPPLDKNNPPVTLNIENPPQGLELTNNLLYVWFNLLPNLPEAKEKDWYAGCATSVRLRNNEFLDSYRGGWFGLDHDPEKRAMQISAIEVLRAPWETTEYFWVRMYDRPYRIVADSNDCLRASVTIASSPFIFPYWDPFEEMTRYLSCSLYRVLSLYADADYILEEMFIKAVTDDQKPGSKRAIMNPTFRAHYFASMDLSWDPQVCQTPAIPDWFAVGACKFASFPGYGFATDVHASPLINPVPGYPDKEHPWKSYAWHLLPAKSANCVHLFMNNEPNDLGRAGRYWYEFCYKPLKAVLIGGD